MKKKKIIIEKSGKNDGFHRRSATGPGTLEEIRAGELSNIDPYSKVNEDGEALMPYIWTQFAHM